MERNNMSFPEYKNISLFSIGKLISLFGSSIYSFAVGLYVLRITGSGLSFAVTMIFSILPVILVSPIAGIIADRFDKKKVIVICDTLNGLLFFALYFIAKQRGLELILIYSSTFLTVVLTTLFNISMESSKPDIVYDKNLLKLNSISKIIDSLSNILAPIIGGLVFGFMNIHSFILFNGISFIVSAILEVCINFRFNNTKGTKANDTKVDFIKDLKEGFIYIKKKSFIAPLLSLFVILNVFLSFCVTIPLPYIINNYFGLSSEIYGLIQGIIPCGLIFGAVIIKVLMDRMSYREMFLTASGSLGIIIIAIGLPLLVDNMGTIMLITYYCILMAITGLIIAMLDIPIMYILQSKVEEAYRGRVLSLSISICKIVTPLSYLISGLLINNIQLWTIPIIGGTLLLLITIILSRNESMKNLDMFDAA